MNVVKILLVLGLGYVATTQKSEKTRNMLLIVTGLLAFCMFSVEGFDSITFDGSGTIDNGGTVTANGATYTFPAGFDVASGQLEASDWTCPSGKTPKPLTPTALSTARTAIAGALTATNIDSVFPCATDCPTTAPNPHNCGAGKKYKTSPTGSSYTGGIGEDNYIANCCETDTTTNTNTNACADKGPCTADKCNSWAWGDHGERCETGVLWDTYCDPPTSS